MHINILWIAALLFAQNSFALSKRNYECISYDRAIKIQFNVYVEEGRNQYIAADAFQNKKEIFYADNVQERDGILKAKNIDGSKKYVFDVSSLTLKESSAGKIFGKVNHYECTERIK